MLIKREHKRTNKRLIADVQDAIYYNSLDERSVNFLIAKRARYNGRFYSRCVSMK